MNHDLTAIRDLYDQDQRRNLREPDLLREELPNLVRFVSRTGGRGIVLYSHLHEAEADAAIRGQIAYFAGLGQSFEWKVFAHDTPPDLRERLRAHGFQIGAPEAVMVFDAAAAPPVLLRPPCGDLRRISDPAELADVIAIEDEVWSEDHSWISQRFGPHLRDETGYVAMFVAYAGGRPASTAWMTFSSGSRFAGLWGGSTLVEHRGRGLYSDLLAARVQEARRRGVRFLTVDASPMSRPILERHGFQVVSWAYECVWELQRAPEDAR
jgi:GNAT superfamily N-acetyltransferase